MEKDGDIKPKYAVGRPSILNEVDENGNFINAQIVLFFQLLANGSTIRIAAGASGIAESTIFMWMNYGKQDLKKGLKTQYVKFIEILKKKQNECQAKLIIDIIRNKDWKAKAWYLERMNKELRLNKQEEENENSNRRIIYNGTVPRQ